MISGFDTALGEITLVLFTTLAPSGALAFLLMGLPVLSGAASSDERARINKFLSIPLVVSMIGLVASATHLGSPANALYVFSAVGSSPLSNEVFFAVIFLMLAGLYWLYSFSQQPNERLMRLWILCIDIAALAFIVAVGFAYSSRTVPSWNLWQVPLGIAANALLGGPLLVLASYAVGNCASLNRARGRAMIALAAIAFLANLLIYGSQMAVSLPMENSLTSVAELVPAYELALAAFAVLAAAAIALAALAVRKLPGRSLPASESTETSAEPQSQRLLAQLLPAALLCLAAIFIMRFCFYMSHLTVGLGV